jgi:predicted dehydrogenase
MNASLVSRRQFLKTSTLAAASLPLLSTALADPPARKLGFALCGLGSLSTNQIAPALQQTRFCRLAGIVTGTSSKAAHWKEQYNLPDHCLYNYDNMDQLANNPDIDVVYVVTPNALHAEHTIKAAKAGKHVLCEKPMEVSTAKCQQMIDACREAGRQLAIGYRLHFEPNTLECARLVREKVFGPTRMIEAGFGFEIGDPKQWRLNRALSGGGPLMDVGIYALQAARFVSGTEPVQVTAVATNTNPDKFRDIEESLAWQMEFSEGVLASCQTSYRFNGLNRFHFFAADGSFGLEDAFGYGGMHGSRSDGQMIQLPHIDQFAAEMDDFAQCILANRPTSVPGEEGLRDIKIMMAIYEAAKTGRAVRLS